MQEEILAGPQAARDFLRGLVQENPGSPFGAVLTAGDARVAGDARPLVESTIQALDAHETNTRREDGYVDDMQALASAWGFELESIAAPVHLLQGTDDLMVPPAHAEWLRDHIPGASLRLLPGQGHLLQPFHADVFAWLTAS
jgi:pimeloyl-ACP methyl ester carboxylesterase